MGVNIDIVGQGHIYGGPASISAFAITEDATPISPADSTGGTGSFTFSANESPRDDGSLLLIGNRAYVTDGSNGLTVGEISEVTVQDGAVNATVDSRLNMLVPERQVLPFAGALGDAITYYLDLAGIRFGIVIDPTLVNRPVVYPGWKGSIWDNLKQICAVEQIEIALVTDNVVVRPLRARTAVTYRDSSRGITIARGETALNVGIYLYNSESRPNDTLAYPRGGYNESIIGWWNDEPLTVNAGEVVETVFELDASLATVSQPVQMETVAQTYSATSVYSVIDQQGNVVRAAEWQNNGGFLSVVLNPDTTSITVTLQGAQLDAARGPFRIASNDTTVPLTEENDVYPVYNSLRIVGTGVFYTKELHTFSTSADPEVTSTIDAATVDSPFVSTYEKLYTAACNVMGTYSGADQTLTVTTVGINRVGVTGSTDYMTFAEYDALQPAGSTFKTFDNQWAGQDFLDFDDFHDSLVADKFKNQAYGNVAGARVRDGKSFYRVTQAQFSESSVQYTAKADTLLDDFDNEWDDDATFADFDAQWTTKSFNDFDRIPLWANGIGPEEEYNSLYPSE